jgi:hypothetical protein
MEWLEATLAFIITMMLLSTIASMVVETLHRFFRLREKGLEQTLSALFEKVIWPKVTSSAKKMANDGALKELWQSNFVAVITGNEVPKTRKPPERWYFIWSWLKWLVVVGVGKMTNEQKRRGISTLEMVERLAETNVGRRISQRAQELGEKAEEFKTTVIVGISDKFEDMSEEVRDIFSRRAKLLSVVVGFLLAFGLNVDAPKLFESYLRDPVLRQKIIAQGEAVAGELEKTKQSLQAELATTDPATLDQLTAGAQQISEQIKKLDEHSIPLSLEGSPLYGKQLRGGDFWRWFLSVTLGGFLIGLGGPFWFDSFRKVSALTTIARRFVNPAKQTSDAAAQPSADAANAQAQSTSTGQTISEDAVVAVFNRAERFIALNAAN